MKVLVINCGSSSLKYQLLDMDNENLLAKGLVERIGIEGSLIKQTRIVDDDKYELETPINDFNKAISLVLDAISSPDHGVISDMSEIGAVGHRAVHAGEYYTESVVIDDDVISALEACIELAPLHNPGGISGIKACKELMPETPMVAVFDTAFHQTMPAESYIYPIPYEYYDKYRVRRYGFHGTSHKYVSKEAADMLGKDITDLKIITCHLGNGASISAVKNGKVHNTSMGFTPLAGIAMGTRCGDVDPSALFYIAKKENMSIDDIDNVANKQSGVYGVSGISPDFRDIGKAASEGDERAELALKVYAQRVKDFIGAYIAEMNGVDAIVFTAGIGENDKGMRARICSDMDYLGIEICDKRNQEADDACFISTDDSKVKVLMIPTNEELMIARDTKALTE